MDEQQVAGFQGLGVEGEGFADEHHRFAEGHAFLDDFDHFFLTVGGDIGQFDRALAQIIKPGGGIAAMKNGGVAVYGNGFGSARQPFLGLRGEHGKQGNVRHAVHVSTVPRAVRGIASLRFCRVGAGR